MMFGCGAAIAIGACWIAGSNSGRNNSYVGLLVFLMWYGGLIVAGTGALIYLFE